MHTCSCVRETVSFTYLPCTHAYSHTFKYSHTRTFSYECTHAHTHNHACWRSCARAAPRPAAAGCPGSSCRATSGQLQNVDHGMPWNVCVHVCIRIHMCLWVCIYSCVYVCVCVWNARCEPIGVLDRPSLLREQEMKTSFLNGCTVYLGTVHACMTWAWLCRSAIARCLCSMSYST